MLKLVWMTDLHLVESGSDLSAGVDPLTGLRDAIEEMMRFHNDPIRLVISGDLVQLRDRSPLPSCHRMGNAEPSDDRRRPAALPMAVWRRKPKKRLLIHSDQGSQFTSMDWASFLRAHNLEHSMGRRGNCHDNAVAESFFNLFKHERMRRRSYKTRTEARQDVFDYIEMFYNLRVNMCGTGCRHPPSSKAAGNEHRGRLGVESKEVVHPNWTV